MFNWCTNSRGAPPSRVLAPALALAAVLAAVPSATRAMCLGDLQGTDGALGVRIARDAHQAIGQLNELLADPGKAQVAALTPAHLYAMQSDAYSISGDTLAAIQAARHGLDALTDADPAPLRRRLRLRYIFMQDDLGHLNQAASDYEAESARMPDDAPELTCVLADRGYLRSRAGRIADAVSDLLRAAELARAQGSERYRIEANVRLAPLYSRYGFYDESRTLVDEALAFYEKQGDRVGIVDSNYALGDLLRDQGKLEESRAVFAKTLAMTQDMDDRSDVPTLEERLCRVDALLNMEVEARRVCADGYAAALANKDPEDAKRILVSLARVELSAGHPGRAAALMDRALADDGVDMPLRWLAQMHLLRAQALTQTGDAVRALADMKIYADWLGDDRIAKNVARVGIIRLTFDRALRDQELARLRAEATTARLTASQRTLTLNIVLLAAALIVAALLGLVWIRRRRWEALRQVQAAQERLAAMSQVTGGIAHDFNNQLTVMQHAVWMLLQRPELAGNTEVLELLRGIQQSSRDCAHITSQMQSFSRQQNLQPEAIPLGRWLRRHQALFQELAGAAVAVQLDADDPGPVAWADPRLLIAALLNLVANARDATAGTGSIGIRAVAGTPATVLVTVEDHGCGMTPEVMARATEPFFTTRDVGRGSGLGLSMVAGFATQSGGSLRLSSEPGRGTVASLQLPAADGTDRPHQRAGL